MSRVTLVLTDVLPEAKLLRDPPRLRLRLFLPVATVAVPRPVPEVMPDI